MATLDWRTRCLLFAQRFWQPTVACMTCMPGGLGKIASAVHWAIALQTGLVTGVLALLVTLTPAVKLFANRLGNAAVVAGLAFVGAAYSRSRSGDVRLGELVATAAMSGVLAWAASFLVEDRGRRCREAWRRLRSTVSSRGAR